MSKIILFANTDWFLYNFRLASAIAAKENGDEVVLVSPIGQYAKKLMGQGFRWRELRLERRGINPLSELDTILRLIRLYQEEKPDLVHHFTVKCVLYGTLAAQFAGIKSIVNSLTGLGYIFTGQRTFWRLPISMAYQILLRHTWTIFENTDDQDLFLKRGWITPKRSTMILGAGVDTDLFKPLPESQGTPLIILPARMLWDKGVGEFVAAVRLLRRRNVQARYVLVGDSDPGNPTGIPLQTLTTWNKEGIVEWWGWQEEMNAVYPKANIICLPSYREGLPKTLIEAAASARAIVSTDVPGCREVVVDGYNGFLVPVQDPEALADKLESLINDPTLRGKMGENGRRHALQHFSLQHITKETLSYYHQIITATSN